jgi:hypothetical protein
MSMHAQNLPLQFVSGALARESLLMTSLSCKPVAIAKAYVKRRCRSSYARESKAKALSPVHPIAFNPLRPQGVRALVELLLPPKALLGLTGNP